MLVCMQTPFCFGCMDVWVSLRRCDGPGEEVGERGERGFIW